MKIRLCTLLNIFTSILALKAADNQEDIELREINTSAFISFSSNNSTAQQSHLENSLGKPQRASFSEIIRVAAAGKRKRQIRNLPVADQDAFNSIEVHASPEDRLCPPAA